MPWWRNRNPAASDAEPSVETRLGVTDDAVTESGVASDGGGRVGLVSGGGGVSCKAPAPIQSRAVSTCHGQCITVTAPLRRRTPRLRGAWWLLTGCPWRDRSRSRTSGAIAESRHRARWGRYGFADNPGGRCQFLALNGRTRRRSICSFRCFGDGCRNIVEDRPQPTFDVLHWHVLSRGVIFDLVSFDLGDPEIMALRMREI